MREVTTAIKLPFSTSSFRVDPNINTVFPRIIAGGDYFFFASKGAIIRGKRLSHQIITSNELNMGFLSVLNLVR